MRPITGIIIILIPLANSLDLTAILSIVMALIVFCLFWENVTSLRCDAQLWERWENTRYPEDSNLGSTCHPPSEQHSAEIASKAEPPESNNTFES
jgi:hypothetical protein